MGVRTKPAAGKRWRPLSLESYFQIPDVAIALDSKHSLLERIAKNDGGFLVAVNIDAAQPATNIDGNVCPRVSVEPLTKLSIIDDERASILLSQHSLIQPTGGRLASTREGTEHQFVGIRVATSAETDPGWNSTLCCELKFDPA